MTVPQMVLPSVDVAVLMLRDVAVAGLIPVSAYTQIRTAAELPADVDPIRATPYRAGAAACLLEFGALLPDGVFPALVAAVCRPAAQ